jgi:hypothetical protein
MSITLGLGVGSKKAVRASETIGANKEGQVSQPVQAQRTDPNNITYNENIKYSESTK